MNHAPNLKPKYTLAARALHWLSVVFLVLAWATVEFEGVFGVSFNMTLHKSLGLSLFLLVVSRLFYRLTHTPPALTTPMSKLQRQGAHAVHGFLYLLLLAQPLTGILMSWFSGRSVPFFGLFQLEAPFAPNLSVAGAMYELHHDVVFPTLVALSTLHVGFALYHHFIKKDELLNRMF